MEIVATRVGDEQVELTLSYGDGLVHLEGLPSEVVALCDAMDDAALAADSSDDRAWLATVRVGSEVVRVGVGAGRVRMVFGG